MTVGNEPLFLGDYFQLMCTVIHGDSPFNIFWLFNDKNLTYKNEIKTELSGMRSSLLSIESIKAKHAGNLTCVAENKAGNITSTVELHVKGIIYNFINQALKKMILFC